MHESISQTAANQVRVITGIVARIRQGQTPAELEIMEVLDRGFAQLIELMRSQPAAPTDGTHETTASAGVLRGALDELLRTVVGGQDGFRTGCGFVLPVAALP